MKTMTQVITKAHGFHNTSKVIKKKVGLERRTSSFFYFF
jgi:hypothetical protein